MALPRSLGGWRMNAERTLTLLAGFAGAGKSTILAWVDAALTLIKEGWKP